MPINTPQPFFLSRAEELIRWYHEPEPEIYPDDVDELWSHLLKHHLAPDDAARFASLREHFTRASTDEARAAVARELCTWFDELEARDEITHDAWMDADCGDPQCPRWPTELMEPAYA